MIAVRLLRVEGTCRTFSQFFQEVEDPRSDSTAGRSRAATGKRRGHRAAVAVVWRPGLRDMAPAACGSSTASAATEASRRGPSRQPARGPRPDEPRPTAVVASRHESCQGRPHGRKPRRQRCGRYADDATRALQASVRPRAAGRHRTGSRTAMAAAVDRHSGRDLAGGPRPRAACPTAPRTGRPTVRHHQVPHHGGGCRTADRPGVGAAVGPPAPLASAASCVDCTWTSSRNWSTSRRAT